MRIRIALCLCLSLAVNWLGAQSSESLTGEVSFLTAQSIYVRFGNTEPISIGDTLAVGEKPACLLVTAKSSRSVVCSALGDCEVKKGDTVEALVPANTAETEPVANEPVDPPLADEQPNAAEEETVEVDPDARKEEIRGRISVSSYQTVASDRTNRTRLMSRLWFSAQHIAQSRFSFEIQANYRQILQTEIDQPNRYFNVYNLALRYDATDNLRLTLGRNINPKTASLGPLDGLQAENYFGKSYVGVMVGARPDQVTFNPNPNLLQYGAYVGRESQHKDFYGLTTLGFIEQLNRGQIDRRYAYLQHNSTWFRVFSLFTSMEMDVYQRVNGVAQSNLRLPNFYVSGTYRLGRKASLMASYDTRRRVLYYETFQTDIEQLLSEDIARQGVRIRLNVRPVKRVFAGVGYSRRFQEDKQNASDNIRAYVRHSKLPGIGGRLSLTWHMNNSNYLNTQVAALRHNRELIKDVLDLGLYYRLVNYTYLNSEQLRLQHYYGLNLGWSLAHQWAARLSVERTDFNQEGNFRVYVRLIRRFRSSR